MQLLVAAEDKLRQAENVADDQLKECSISLAAQEARQPSGPVDSHWDGKLFFFSKFVFPKCILPSECTRLYPLDPFPMTVLCFSLTGCFSPPSCNAGWEGGEGGAERDLLRAWLEFTEILHSLYSC